MFIKSERLKKRVELLMNFSLKELVQSFPKFDPGKFSDKE